PSVCDARSAVAQKFHELRAADDGGSSDKFSLVELAPLKTRRADVDQATGLDEILHELLQRRKALLTDIVRIPLLGKPHPFRAQKNQCLLVRGHRRIGND